MDARAAQGLQVGDHSTQINCLPPVRVPWPLRVGPVPSLADCYQTRAESPALEQTAQRAARWW
ncbi:MAG: hypothetical protein J2P19_17445 [Pseudonocardia sp.]|nr:hypothetical protein [Pseudonocardia sp.]